MTDQQRWYAGVDWASESHHVFLTDGDGRKTGEKIVKHGGEGLAEMTAWLMVMSGAAEPGQVYVAIEVPHGPVVETLIERGFKVHAINPKQMDRFRDRFTLAGAKDDSRDAEVMASALRTDARCFRLLAVVDPIVIELREWSRITEDLGAERNRLTNRMRELLWRSFPQCSSSRATSARSGCSTCGRTCRRPTRPLASARRRSPRFLSAIASVASTPPTCSTSCVSRQSKSPTEQEQPQARTLRHSSRVSGSSTSAAQASPSPARHLDRPAHSIGGDRAGAGEAA